jgi:hypothetical protein
VREKFRRVKPLKDISVTQRGWTLDVLNAVRTLGKTEFTTVDAYAFTRELEALHPDNRHVRDKISESAVIKRKPLAATACRAGWVDCNIALNRVPAEARIFVVRTTVCEPRNAAVPAAGSSGVPPRERTRSGTLPEPAGADARATNPIIVPPEEVRAQFKRVKPLKDNYIPSQ